MPVTSFTAFAYATLARSAYQRLLGYGSFPARDGEHGMQLEKNLCQQVHHTGLSTGEARLQQDLHLWCTGRQERVRLHQHKHHQTKRQGSDRPADWSVQGMTKLRDDWAGSLYSNKGSHQRCCDKSSIQDTAMHAEGAQQDQARAAHLTWQADSHPASVGLRPQQAFAKRKLTPSSLQVCQTTMRASRKDSRHAPAHPARGA